MKDAKTKVTIKVTRKAIKRAGKLSKNCPVAKAMLDAGYTKVRVGVSDAEGYKGKEHLAFVLPKKATKAIVKFDTGGGMKPFKFTAKVGPVAKSITLPLKGAKKKKK